MAHQRRWLVALLTVLALSMGLMTGVQAATTWTVCASGCDYSSIKAAIAAPTTVDGDTLAIAVGTYTEPGITINKSLTLQGEDADTTIVQAAATQGRASTRVFTITRGVTVTLQDLTIRYGKTASFGGGLYNEGTLTLITSTISGNAATYDGGGLYNDFNSMMTLTSSTVSGNSAFSGGGISNVYGQLTLTSSTVSGNAATFGGGLYNEEGTLTLTSSTISGNAAIYDGGGLYNAGTLTLTSSTISDNAAIYGGGLYNDYGRLTLTSSIVANNLGAGNGGYDCRNNGSNTTSQGYNLDSDGSCPLTAPTDRPGVDPLLGPLQDNGGPTLTQALLPGSPAIDAIPWGTNSCGTTLVSDQRWQARPQALGGACDIGAYEVQVTGQPLTGWVTGLTPETVTCKDVTTGQVVTLNNPATSWDCEAAGVAVTSGDQVSMRVQGPMEPGATDVGGAVTGMAASSGGCMNLTTGQQVQFQHMVGATAASCGVAGLVMHPGDTIQISVQGGAE